MGGEVTKLSTAWPGSHEELLKVHFLPSVVVILEVWPALRARMILACAEGRSNIVVAADLEVSDETVGKWRSRFLERRLDGLSDEPRSGRLRAVTDEDVERVITLTLESTPKDATHWSTRSMAQRSGLSQTTVSRIWRAFALQPHRTETFKLSAEPGVTLVWAAHRKAVAPWSASEQR